MHRRDHYYNIINKLHAYLKMQSVAPYVSQVDTYTRTYFMAYMFVGLRKEFTPKCIVK